MNGVESFETSTAMGEAIERGEQTRDQGEGGCAKGVYSSEEMEERCSTLAEEMRKLKLV